jgi:quercetin dioxygenase-like cupin family protein
MMMKMKIALVISVLALFSIIAWATPGSGVLFNTILNVAQTEGTLHINDNGVASDGSKWHLQLMTEGAPTEVEIQDLALAPGGYGGWHSHPGPVIVTVTAGTVSNYYSDCVRQDYPAGSAFIIPGGVVHNERNESTTETLRLADAFLLPAGTPRRIEEAQPATCNLP